MCNSAAKLQLSWMCNDYPNCRIKKTNKQNALSVSRDNLKKKRLSFYAAKTQ